MVYLVPIFIVGFIVLGVYKVLELFAKKKERLLLIDKLSSLTENEEENEKRAKIQIPLILSGDSASWPLRISLLLIGIGAGCLFAFFIQISDVIPSANDQFNSLVIMVNFASISFFGGIGLFIAFLIEQKNERQQNRKKL